MPSPDDLRKDDAGRWLCNVVKGCDLQATLQAPLPCETGCDAAVMQHDRLIADKRQVITEHENALGIIKAEAERRATAGESMSALERAAAEFGHNTLALARSDLLKLEAARARVASAEHTHPVMACAKHEKRLERLVNGGA